MLPTMLLAIQTAQREREIEDFELAYREAMAKSNASKGSKKPSLGNRRFRACLSRSDGKEQRKQRLEKAEPRKATLSSLLIAKR